MLEAAIAQVVEENAADAARLVAMPEKEIVVAPALEARVVIGAERRKRIATAAVKVHRVLLEAVVRRQVHAAAEPPDGRDAFAGRGEQAHVHVHRRHIRIARMQHQRHAHHFEAAASQLRPSGARRRRKAIAADVREIDAGAFEHVAILEYAAFAAAAFWARPRVAPKSGAVDRLQSRDDARLQLGEVRERGAK